MSLSTQPDEAMTATKVASDGILPLVLLGLTATTGVVDAVSYFALGHVFTANMTGNVVSLAAAAAGAQGLSIGRSGTAVAAFLGAPECAGRHAWMDLHEQV